VSLDLHVSNDGHLDVSNNSLTRISDRQIKNIPNLLSVTSLNASRNKFVVIDFLKLIPNCKCVDASDNQIKRILTFIQLKKTLEVLDISYNQISSTEHFLSQLSQLTALSIHHNSLTTFPAIDELVNLTSLDISYNQLLNFPNVKRLPNLIFLSLNGNKISSLRDISNCLPAHLARLELAENQISDLTEITFLKGLPNLEDFSFASNPAILTPNNKFNYRPYIVSKQLNLKMINDLEVSDEERLVAEHLHINKKISPLGPGENNHTVLVKLLEVESPLSHALETLTPTHPTLKAVQQDYLHNKSASASVSVYSTPRISRTPDANIRRISPRRSATFDESSIILKPLNLPPRRRLRSIDRESSGSEGTVVLSTSISEAMNLACPRIDSTDDSSRTKSLPELPVNDYIDPEFSENTHVNPESGCFVNQYETQYDSILPPIIQSCTKIVKESPFNSIVDETVMTENYLSTEENSNQGNRTLTIIPHTNGHIETHENLYTNGHGKTPEASHNGYTRTPEVSHTNGYISTPEASKETYSLGDPTDIRLMKLENRIQTLESERNADVTVMMNSLVETTKRLTDLLVDVNVMAKSVIGITNNLTNLLMTKPMMNMSTNGFVLSPVNNVQQNLQSPINFGFMPTQIGTFNNEDKAVSKIGTNYARNDRI
ncbi:hypothetical protein FO519_005736, partial [Halicephalobus sp. NKZ332]